MVEGKEPISITVNKSTVKTILRLKQENKFEGTSDYIQQACDFFEKHRYVNRKDILNKILYPWLIAGLLFLWSQDFYGDNLNFRIALFYINLGIFGLVIASTYSLYQRYKQEIM